jgi:hypothetical protein
MKGFISYVDGSNKKLVYITEKGILEASKHS